MARPGDIPGRAMARSPHQCWTSAGCGGRGAASAPPPPGSAAGGRPPLGRDGDGGRPPV